MRMGVLTGLAAEARLLTDVIFDRKAELEIVRTGADPRRAQREAERLVAAGARALVSFGVAGGLCPRLKAGDLVLADRVILPDGRSLHADIDWLRIAHQRLGTPGHAIHIGAIAASNQLLVTPAEKRRLSEASGALAGDMESGGAAAAALEAGLPFLVIRAISDGAARSLPQVARVPLRPDGGISVGRIAQALCTRPDEWPAVARLAFETRAAMMSLKGVARSGALLPPIQVPADGQAALQAA